MPEGHSIHRAAIDQRRELVGDSIRTSSPQGRFEEVGLLDRRVLVEIDAWGKHLFYRFAPRGRARKDTWLHVHLGLYGGFTRHASLPPPPPRGAVRLRMIGARVAIDLAGPTVCEVLDDKGRAAVLARLGPDPLRKTRDGGDGREAARRLHASGRPIGGLLLDQSLVAGIGNVYRAEILFLAGIDPARAGSELSAGELANVWGLSKTLLAAGVRDGRIDTAQFLRGADDVEAMPGRRGRSKRTLVYHQHTCRRRGEAIRTGTMGARTLFWCPHCQQ